MDEGLIIFKHQMQQFIEFKISCYATAIMNLEILNDIETNLNTKLWKELKEQLNTQCFF